MDSIAAISSDAGGVAAMNPSSQLPGRGPAAPHPFGGIVSIRGGMPALLLGVGGLAIVLSLALPMFAGPILCFVLLGIGAPLLSRQSAIHADSQVDMRSGCLVITTPRPSHLRMAALIVLAFALFFFPGVPPSDFEAAGGDAIAPFTTLLSTLIGPLTLMLIPILVLVLLFADRNTVQRVVWGHPRLYRSLAMGPLEFFSQYVRRPPSRLPVLLPPIGVRVGDLLDSSEQLKDAHAKLMAEKNMSAEEFQRTIAHGLEQASIYGHLGSSNLYWTIVLPGVAGVQPIGSRASAGHGLELARFKDEAPARALLDRLLATQVPLPRDLQRVVGQDGVISNSLSLAASWLLRAPLLAALALCLVLVWLAAEAHLILTDRMPFQPHWDSVAEARLERFEWLIAPNVDRHRHSELHDYAAHTVVTVAIPSEAAAGASVRALDWPHYGRWSHHYLPSTREMLTAAARSGMLPAQLAFAIPRDVLDIEVDESGVLRFDRLQVDRRKGRGEDSPYRRLYLGVLVGLDSLDLSLPMYWMQPALEEPIRVVYTAADPADTPAERETDALASIPTRVGFHGFSYFMAGTALMLGAVLVALLASLNGHWQLASWHRVVGLLALWLLIAASALFWMPRFPTVAGWVGMDSTAVSSLRQALQGRTSHPEAVTPEYDDAALIRGHWAPSGSRHARWLAELGLLDPPSQRAATYEAAVEALHAELEQRLAGLTWPQRLRFMARYRPDYLTDNGSSRMHDQVIAPAICRWKASGDPEAAGMERFTGVLSHARCK